MSSGALREIFAAFRVSVDTSEMTAADSKIGAFAKKLEGVAQGFVAAFAASKLVGFIEAQAALGTELKNTADRLGMTTTGLQAFHLGMAELGQSSDQADNSLGFFLKAVGRSEEGAKGASKALAELGISTKDAHGQVKPLETLLGDAAEGLSKMTDHAKMAAISQELFGRTGARTMIPFLSKGRAGVAGMSEELAGLGGAYSKDMIAKSQEATRALARLRVGFEGLRSRISVALLPVFTKAVGIVSKMTTAFIKFTDKTYTVQSALMFLAGASTIAQFSRLWSVLGLGARPLMQTLGLFARFAIPAAAIYALYLIFNDLYTLMEGGDSYVGRLLDQLGGIGTKDVAINNIKAAFEALKVVGADLGTTVQGVGAAFGLAFNGALPTSIALVIGGVKVLGAGLTTIATALSEIVELTMSLGDLVTLDIKGAGKHLGNAQQSSSDWWKSMNALFPDTDDGKGSSQKMLADINSGRTAKEARENNPDFAHTNVVTRPPAMGGGPVAPSVTNNGPTTIKVEVNGVKGDPGQVGSAVGKSTKEALDSHRQAMKEAQRGMRPGA